MRRFKKRLRLLTEKHGGTISCGHDESLIVAFSSGRAHFSSLDYHDMHCDVTVGETSFPIRVPKSFCFDITFRLASTHLCKKLHKYQRGTLLELSDYFRGEQGDFDIEQFKLRLASDPTIASADFGGDRILAEFYHGVLVLYDDLCMDATNVFEF